MCAFRVPLRFRRPDLAPRERVARRSGRERGSVLCLLNRAAGLFPIAVFMAAPLQPGRADASSPDRTVFQVQIEVVDSQGLPIPARLHARDAAGVHPPGGPDSVLISHHGGSMGGYLYVEGPVTLPFNQGVGRLVAGRGFEWRPVVLYPNIRSDTTLTLTLHQALDLRNEGWFGGDVHTHAAHAGNEYLLTPEQVLQVARAENLAILWLLDNEYEFTGSPHALSTPETALYFTAEYRNQVYGHAAMLGLRELMGTGCCHPPGPAYPMLTDLRQSWQPAADEGICLAHTWSGAEFFDDSGWPGWGLGRELPVLATGRILDAVDIASYSIEGDVHLNDWYALLNCGLQAVPSAGTDAMMNRYFGRPTGGYRVFVYTGGVEADPAAWVEGLRAGRVFVSNYPLIPEFRVEGAQAGDTLELPGPQTVRVHLRIASTLSVGVAEVVVRGVVRASIPIPSGPEGSFWEGDLTVLVEESGWLAVRVRGSTQVVHAASPSLFAHTGPVYLRVGQDPAESTIGAARFIDWIDSLEVFAEMRDNWPDSGTRNLVLGRLQSSRNWFRAQFHIPPEPFELVSPAEDETLSWGYPAHFDWTDSHDTEAGDRIRYRLSISADSLFMGALSLPWMEESEAVLEELSLTPDRHYWWRVSAVDRGGHQTSSTPSHRRFFFSSDLAGLEPGVGVAAGSPPPMRIRIAPTPSGGPFFIRIDHPSLEADRIDVYDASGRITRRLSVTRGLSVWDGRDGRGGPVPAGVYWVVASDSRTGAHSSTRAVVIR